MLDTTNLILHKVTNRVMFADPGFNVSCGYDAIPESQSASEVRDLLQLRDSSTDYYVIGVLAAIDAYFDIRFAFGESDRTYEMSVIPQPLPSMIGAALTSDDKGPPRVARKTAVFPPSRSIDINWLDATTARLTNNGTSENVSVRLQEDRILFDWPTTYGVAGALEVTTTVWGATFSASILGMPSEYPYAAVAAQLSNSRSVFLLLTEAGLASDFHAAHSPVEKLAIVALALSQ